VSSDRPLFRLLPLAALVLAVGCSRTDTPPAGSTPSLPNARAWEAENPLVPGDGAWRARHEADYRRDYVTIAALHLLADGRQTLGSDAANDIVIENVPPEIGHLVVEDDRARFEPAPGLDARFNDAELTGPVVMKAAGERAAGEVVVGQVRLVIHQTGDRLALRVRDPDGELARDFLGFTWFPLDASARVVGRFIPDEAPREIPVLNTYDDVTTYRTEGVVEFEWRGDTLRLRPFTSEPNRFFFVFRDASAGEETYEVGRFLYTDLLADGTTVLDFNMAYNPPCAFNPYTTCPVPLPENRLPVKILAGERAYPIKVKLPNGG